MGMKMGERVGVSRRGKFEPGTKIRQKAANFEPGTDLRRTCGSGFSRGGTDLRRTRGWIFESVGMGVPRAKLHEKPAVERRRGAVFFGDEGTAKLRG